jgi:NADH:ubiquinone oxidoreductase subunit D
MTEAATSIDKYIVSIQHIYSFIIIKQICLKLQYMTEEETENNLNFPDTTIMKQQMEMETSVYCVHTAYHPSA